MCAEISGLVLEGGAESVGRSARFHPQKGGLVRCKSKVVVIRRIQLQLTVRNIDVLHISSLLQP
jgi:hypothetical protein